MSESLQPTRRRSFLRGCLTLAAGAVGMKVVEEPSAARPNPPGSEVLRFHFRRRKSHPAPFARRSPKSHRAITARSGGELRESEGGRSVGRFSSHRSGLESWAGLHASAPDELITEVFHLPDGALFALGTDGKRTERQELVIVGGAGRYVGVQGACVFRSQGADQGTVEITLQRPLRAAAI